MDDKKDLIIDSENKENIQESDVQTEIDTENTPEEKIIQGLEEESMPKADIEEIKEVSESSYKEKLTFIDSLTAAIVDTAVISAISVILLYLIDIIMRYTVGLYITDKIAFLFIIFVVITVLYPCFMNTYKGYTMGIRMIKGKK